MSAIYTCAVHGTYTPTTTAATCPQCDKLPGVCGSLKPLERTYTHAELQELLERIVSRADYDTNALLVVERQVIYREFAKLGVEL
jgi:hypothetical protein